MNGHKHYYYINNGLSYFTNTTHWKPAFNKSYWWVQKSGNAYDAIQELCNTSFHTDGECAGAVIACIWWASSQVLEKDAFNLAYSGEKALNMRKFADEKDDSFRRKHIKYAIDFTVHIPGDWLYMKNHNYGKVVNKKTNNKEFWKKKDQDTGLPWLDENQSYPWSGENAFYTGKNSNGIAIYEGLGLRESEEDMRDELRLAYNRQLKKVIDNDGKVDGVEIEEINEGADANNKITWTSVVRIYPLLNN